MNLVSVLILVVLVISAVLLTLIVLIQDDQGGGIGGMFGGGDSNSAFGSRTGNVLTRGTAILATVFLVSAFALAWFSRSTDGGNVIGRARAQRAQSLSDTNWWVDTSAAVEPLSVTGHPIAATAAVAADDEPATANDASSTEGQEQQSPAPQTSSQGG